MAETQLLAEQIILLPRAEVLRVWEPLGHASMLDYMERELGLAPRPAIERLRIARALEGLPAISDAFAAGTLGYSVVRELARVAVPATDRAWLEAAWNKVPKQVEEMVSGRKAGDLPDAPKQPDLVLRTISLRLTPPKVALLRHMQSELRDGLGKDDSDDDFIEALWRRFAVGSAEHRPAYQISISKCDDCQRAWQTSGGTKTILDQATVACAECDHESIGCTDDESPPRRTSTVSARRRQQVLARDAHRCVVPGCRSTRFLDVHHIVFQARGGKRDLRNLISLCAGHHRRLHDGRLLIVGTAPDKLRFRFTQSGQEVQVGTKTGGETHVGAGRAETHVVAGRAETHVGAGRAETHVVAGRAETHVVAGRAETHVGAGHAETHVGAGHAEPHSDTDTPDPHVGETTHAGTKTGEDTHVGAGHADAHMNTKTGEDTHVGAGHAEPHSETDTPDPHVGEATHAGTKTGEDTHVCAGHADAHVNTKTGEDTHVGAGHADAHVNTKTGEHTHVDAGHADTHVGAKTGGHTHVGADHAAPRCDVRAERLSVTPILTGISTRRSILPAGASLLDAEARVALKGAGFRSTEAAVAVGKARAACPDVTSLEQLLRLSLQIAGRGGRSTG